MTSSGPMTMRCHVFGQGAFRIIVENLYREVNQLKDSQHLHSIIMGKPFKIQYDFAHHNSPFKSIFMVGDNPASDIKGANDNGWESILVRTGVYDNEDLSTIIAQPTVGYLTMSMRSSKQS
ncbi:hypothetical protein G9P44_005452 [Scheffersomyces stipitis]|nr:hypothetical protein G9P44_005452 [Scheffersomyces stipitis]